jgi:hypothetical protein
LATIVEETMFYLAFFAEFAWKSIMEPFSERSNQVFMPFPSIVRATIWRKTSRIAIILVVQTIVRRIIASIHVPPFKLLLVLIALSIIIHPPIVILLVLRRVVESAGTGLQVSAFGSEFIAVVNLFSFPLVS